MPKKHSLPHFKFNKIKANHQPLPSSRASHGQQITWTTLGLLYLACLESSLLNGKKNIKSEPRECKNIKSDLRY
jgi:hypothetical protein